MEVITSGTNAPTNIEASNVVEMSNNEDHAAFPRIRRVGDGFYQVADSPVADRGSFSMRNILSRKGRLSGRTTVQSPTPGASS